MVNRFFLFTLTSLFIKFALALHTIAYFRFNNSPSLSRRNKMMIVSCRVSCPFIAVRFFDAQDIKFFFFETKKPNDLFVVCSLLSH